jgi:hypothetical protein
MNKVRWFAVLLILVLVVALIPGNAMASAETSNGTIGETVSWKYDDGTLNLIGEGRIDCLSDKNEAPWYHLRERITKVVISEGIHTIGEAAFKDLCELKEVSLPNSLQVIGANAFQNCASMEYIHIPNGVESILRGAFRDCTALKSFTMPNSVETTESDLFKNCESLKTAQLSAKLKLLPSNSFFGCVSLTEIVLNEKITGIGYSAFENCRSLTEVVFLGNITYIDFFAFRNCTSLKSIELPASVERIGFEAFSNCKSMQRVRFTGDLPAVSDLALYFNKPHGAKPCVVYYPANNRSWLEGKDALLATRFEDDYVLEADTASNCVHTPSVTPGEAATCTETGLTEGLHCVSCGKVLKAQTAIAALGHDLMTVTMEPNCTEPGFDLYQCSRCTHRETGNIVQPLGHDYGDWQTITEPTIEAAGLAQRVCATCGEIQQQELEKLSPPPTEPQPTEPATQPTIQPTAPENTIQLVPAEPKDRALASVGVVLVLLAVTAVILIVKWLTRKRP